MTEKNSYSRQPGVVLDEPDDRKDDRPTSASSIIYVLTKLARRKWLILKFTGAGILAGLVLCFALPVRYTAITRIMPPKQTQSTTTFLNTQMGAGALSDMAGGGLLKDPNAIYIGLLKSRPVADTIITRFRLAEVYRSKDMTAARKKLESNTQVVSEKSTLISISVSDGDKQRATDIANVYTEQLRTLSKTISVTEASRRRLFFEEQLKSQKETLIAAENAFQQVEQNKGLVHLDTQANVIIGGLAALRAQIASREIDLQALRSYSTEHNPDVQLTERELSAMEAEAAQMEQHSRLDGNSDMGLKDIPKAGLDYVRAQRELEYQQAFYDLLLRQYEAARLDEAKDAAVIQVVEPAILPDRKSAPKRWLLMVFCALAGFYLGCFIAWAQTKFESQSPESQGELLALKTALLRW
jgi:tyrosine-protein kinase Etk/Wzc